MIALRPATEVVQTTTFIQTNSTKTISDPVWYGCAGGDSLSDYPRRSEQSQLNVLDEDTPMRDTTLKKFAIFEPDSLVARARLYAMSEDPVSKLNAAKKL